MHDMDESWTCRRDVAGAPVPQTPGMGLSSVSPASQGRDYRPSESVFGVAARLDWCAAAASAAVAALVREVRLRFDAVLRAEARDAAVEPER